MNLTTRAGFLKKLTTHFDETPPLTGGLPNTISDKGLAPYKGEWGAKQILHLLRRSLFGVKPEELKHFSKLNMQQCLDELFIPDDLPYPPVNAYNEGNFIDPVVPPGQIWVTAPYGPLPAGVSAAMRISVFNSLRRFSLKGWWAGLMLQQKPSITPKMMLFWHTAISTQMKLSYDARYSYKHLTLLYTHALGNFKHLIREVTTDPQMLVYQNGNTNTASAPNENYARELQELFTVGKGPDSHYTEEDVRAAARVLTGWTDNFTSHESTNISSSFVPANHDTGNKVFSAFYKNTVIKGRNGADGAKELDELIDMIFNTTETARTLCRKLYRYFVYYTIDETVEKNVIAPLAEILIADNFEMKNVVKRLLSSEHFYDVKNMGCVIKNPADLVIGTARQFDIKTPDHSDYVMQHKTWVEFSNLMEIMDMNIGDPPTVAGWPAYYQKPSYHEFWINSDMLGTRSSVFDRLLSKEGYNENGVFIKIDYLSFTSRLTDPDNPDKLISESTNLLSAVAFDDLQADYAKKQFLLSGQSNNSSWTELWNNYVAKPNDEINRKEVEERLQHYYAYLLSRAEYQLI